MSKDEKILINSEGESQGCSDYKDGYCNSTGGLCDGCYENSLRMFIDNNNIDNKNKMINWNTFILGESELKCESLEDAQLLLDVCKENKIDYSYLNAEDYKEEPYWYVKCNDLYITRYSCDNENICDCWTVKEYVINHMR